MAKLFSKDAARMFGESFVAEQQFQEQLQQRRQEVEREYGFRNRQLDLAEAFRRDELKQTADIEAARESNKIEKYKTDLYASGFRPQDQLVGRENIRTGEFDTEEPTINAFGETFGYPIQQPQPRKGAELTPLYEGMVERNYEIDPATGEKITTGFGSLFRPYESTLNPSGGKNGSNYKEGKLSESGVKALNYLTDPDNLANGFVQNLFGTGVSSYDEVRAEVDANIRTFAKDIVSSNTHRWVLQNLEKNKKYLSPAELNDKAINAVEKGDLDENEIDTFLNYYETIYRGIQELEKRK